ncbi:MAG: phenylalanine--tRNA ligase subunit beta [Chitinophagaceae bacterium]
MTISYNWLSDYLPAPVKAALDPARLSHILTSLGLEVEGFEQYESIRGGLQGLVIGEVIECAKHPNADKLSLTRVNIGQDELLQIVCGAPNVAAGQKVIVATIGTTIHPKNGEPLTMKPVKIRGAESQGMICAEDEIGIGDSHEGIVVLPEDAKPGHPAAELFPVYNDWIYEIGLTPNRMDAMSHLGVARDVCAYLSHHDDKDYQPVTPFPPALTVNDNSLPFEVVIENPVACARYSGLSIKNVQVKPSPSWLQERLKAIGLRPINNIVDITNYILHEAGQPLHAFDADKIKGRKVIVKNLPSGTNFVSLDKKERKLHAEDLMICNGNSEGMCIAGVFGGIDSGVTDETKNIFLESAWFNPVDIRKTSFRHNLRTDAAARFEKNVDISNTVKVLERTALLIKDLAGGEPASQIIDVYPGKKDKTQVRLTYAYLQKLSGKHYQPATAKKILSALGFEIIHESAEDIAVAVPYSKPDISLPADIVEEIMRIDGYDNIAIPSSITITPAVETSGYKHTYIEKAAGYLAGLGFNEIFTNSITNSIYYTVEELQSAVKMLNSLSADLNIMRFSMLETGLESVAHNLNRKNNDLRFFEFGHTYSTAGSGRYDEVAHFSLYVTGQVIEGSWKNKAGNADIYYIKGVVQRIFQLLGLNDVQIASATYPRLEDALSVHVGHQELAVIGSVDRQTLNTFSIKQPVFYADLNWDRILQNVQNLDRGVKELPKQLPVHRDLAMVVSKSLRYGQVEESIRKIGLNKLQQVQLFDVFESDKLGVDKKSLAVSFTFLDEEKTLTDKEIDGMMNKIMATLEKEIQADIRKA